MHICFTLSSLSAGGAERVASSLCNYFCGCGHKVSIVLVSIDHNNSFYKLDEKIEVYPLLVNVKTRNPIKRIRLLKNKIQSLNPDIVISFLHHICIYTHLALKNTNIPYICSERCDPNQYPLHIKLLLKSAFKKADGCVFQTRDAKRFYKKCKNSAIIPNPVFLSLSSSIERHSTKDKVFISVGRLTNQKNFSFLIDVFGEFVGKHSDYKLVIYGEGPHREKLQQQITNLSLNNYISLPGNNNQWHDEAINASCFISTSIYEGMPNCIEESLSLGCPVIATDCPVGGSKDLIEMFGVGKLIQMNNKQQLLQSMEEIINEPSSSGTPDYSFVNIDSIGQKWLHFIMNTINQKR